MVETQNVRIDMETGMSYVEKRIHKVVLLISSKHKQTPLDVILLLGFTSRFLTRCFGKDKYSFSAEKMEIYSASSYLHETESTES
jgi:hypothetical protein